MAFSDFTGLSVNDTALNIKVANVMLKALIQGKLYNDGVGITEVYSADATYGGAVLRVPKITSSTGDFRTVGATTNGGFFNGSSVVVSTLTEEVLYAKHVYDLMEDVPEAQHVLSLAGASAVGIRAERIAAQITKQMNAGTMAYQLASVINAVITASAQTNRIFTYDGSTVTALDALISSMTSLDDGDSSFNDYFPTEGRLVLARPTFYGQLFAKGQVIVGGSNFAQEMLKVGALDRDLTVLPDNNVGYKGTVLNMPIFLASSALWTQAESWLQQDAGYLDEIVAIVCSYRATGRGYAFPEQVKIIDSPSGVGLRIQPLSNFGVKVFFEGGIKLIANSTFAPGLTALTVEAPGSQA